MEFFTHGLKGLLAEGLFKGQPVIWVEGPSDVYFYKAMLNKEEQELFSVVPVGGIKKALALLEELRKDKTIAGLVVTDGDYRILNDHRLKVGGFLLRLEVADPG